MNREEHRVLRAIEKNLAVDDPALAELLRPPKRRRRRWIYRAAGWLAMGFVLVGLAVGNAAFLLIAGISACGAVLSWAAQAVADDDIARYRD